MAESRPYASAPIIEAIIDLRVSPRIDLSADDVDDVHRGEEEAYPQREDTIEAVGIMELGAGGAATASARQSRTGSKFSSEDGRYVWQARLDGFTMSRLAPYEHWTPFRDEARRLWTIYRERLEPEAVTRVAIRNVNRIDIPVSDATRSLDLHDYFRTLPDISPDLPQSIDQFFLRLSIPCESVHGKALINQTIVPPPGEGVISVVLDIDLFCSESIPSDDEGIWRLFEQLREAKNEIFEACITPKTRELFD